MPCRLLRATGEGPWEASVRNVSAGGIGLITSRPFKAGMLLTVEPPMKGSAKPKVVKVTHAAAQANGKWWVIGAVFASPISREDMAAFL